MKRMKEESAVWYKLDKGDLYLLSKVLLRRCKSCDDAQVSFPLNSDIRSCAVMRKHF